MQNAARKKKDEAKHWKATERGDRFRREVEAILGPPPPGEYVAHHPFPVEFHADFDYVRIDTTNPVYGTWVKKALHTPAFNKAYNRHWKNSLQEQNSSENES
jgi:hypothetical protein